ncbi:hypothetical protein [Pseudoxanthomonas putridarboris]|uniref:Uncharacterized protein n=1 Tax=Pseudoxanthomonas putridarboris TaxID=752605 RepID=A0ABU9IXW6_9GAMM
MTRLIARSLTLALIAALSTPAWSAPQSDGASRHSQASLAASVEVPVAVVHALGHGASAVVSGVGASVGAVAGSVAVTVSVVGVGASFVVYLSVEAIRRLGIVVGTALSVAVVATGWIISAAGEALCFIANDTVRPHIHSHRYGG